VLEDKFGTVLEMTRLSKDETNLSFGVGFKYDEDALSYVRYAGSIKGENGKRLVGVPTAVFRQCLPMIREAWEILKKEKERSRSRSPKHHRSYSSEKERRRRKRSRSA
jgi:hypothetical protein